MSNQAAGLDAGRRTSFYCHSGSPEDLAIHALSDLFDVVGNADIVMRSRHNVSGAEVSRRALREIVGFVAERRASYVRLLGPGGRACARAGDHGAFTDRTVEALERMDVRPAAADPRITARFLAGGCRA
jgi:hypothetical protein